MSYVSKFNEQLLQFIKELSELFPEDKLLKTFYHSIEFLKKNNPREVMNQFRIAVYPFKTQILEKNEAFFIENNFNNEIKNTSSISEMLRIKSIWTSGQLTEKDKECIWNYFKVFIYLIDKEYSTLSKGF